MKNRDIVITVVVTNLVSILLASVVFKALQGDKTSVAVQTKAAATPAPAAPAVPDKPVVDKDAVFALLDKDRESRRKEAIREFKKVMQNVPPYEPLGTVATGYRIALDGDIKKAIDITQEEIARNSRRVDSHYTLAWIYAKVGDYDKALKVCQDAMKLGPDFYKLYFIEGWVYAKQGKYEEALKVCDAALASEPYSAGLYYAKGRIEDFAGHSDKAIEFYSKAISIKKDFYPAYVFLGILYTELGRMDEAIKIYKEAISLDKYRTGSYVGLGLVYDETANYQAALTQYNNAITLGWVSLDATTPNKPLAMSIEIDDAVIYNRMGILNIRLGNYKAALDLFIRAIAARQEYHESYRGLILTHVLLGEKESAVKAYNELKMLNPEMANSVAAFVGQNP